MTEQNNNEEEELVPLTGVLQPPEAPKPLTGVMPPPEKKTESGGE